MENPFEKVVLRLLALRRYGAAELAAETCLPGELIRFILLRLVDKGYIDDQHDLLDAGRAALGSSLRNEAADVTFSTYLVFRERISDTLLPMLVSTNDLPVRESEGRDHVKVFVGTNATVRATALGRTSGSSPVPTGRQVEEVLARMSRRARVVGSAGPGRLSGHGIVVTAEPEPYLLRCKLVIQRFDSDWRITDPSGQGYSVDLERAYRDAARTRRLGGGRVQRVAAADSCPGRSAASSCSGCKKFWRRTEQSPVPRTGPGAAQARVVRGC